ncbi:MAG: SDR family oxidoreductase, partial [Bacteroidales bacterium]|nr:SDR family oxidoreductase [Bacteroidales bacterium]
MSYNLLKGKKGIIFGALDHKSIAWKVAEKAYEEGARIVLTNTPAAIRFGEIEQLAEKTQSIVIPADATNVNDIENVYLQGMEFLDGKI